MKRIALLLAAMLLVTTSCKKDWDEWVCFCKSPYPIANNEPIPDILWTEYNSVHNACLYFERIVNLRDLIQGNLPSYVLSHYGDTLKVYGWLYNAKNAYFDSYGNWIANDEKYASGSENMPPRIIGEGIELKKLHVTDSTYIRNKCFLTGIITFKSIHAETVVDDAPPCQHLRLVLDVIDIYFEEDAK